MYVSLIPCPTSFYNQLEKIFPCSYERPGNGTTCMCVTIGELCVCHNTLIAMPAHVSPLPPLSSVYPYLCRAVHNFARDRAQVVATKEYYVAFEDVATRHK